MNQGLVLSFLLTWQRDKKWFQAVVSDAGREISFRVPYDKGARLGLEDGGQWVCCGFRLREVGRDGGAVYDIRTIRRHYRGQNVRSCLRQLRHEIEARRYELYPPRMQHMHGRLPRVRHA